MKCDSISNWRCGQGHLRERQPRLNPYGAIYGLPNEVRRTIETVKILRWRPEFTVGKLNIQMHGQPSGEVNMKRPSSQGRGVDFVFCAEALKGSSSSQGNTKRLLMSSPGS